MLSSVSICLNTFESWWNIINSKHGEIHFKWSLSLKINIVSFKMVSKCSPDSEACTRFWSDYKKKYPTGVHCTSVRCFFCHHFKIRCILQSQGIILEPFLSSRYLFLSLKIIWSVFHHAYCWWYFTMIQTYSNIFKQIESNLNRLKQLSRI